MCNCVTHEMHTSHHTHNNVTTTATTKKNRLNRMIFGMESAFWFHVVNVLLHSIASMLFTKICYEVIGFKRKYCLLAGIFFAIHPIHTESKSFFFSILYTRHTLLLFFIYISYVCIFFIFKKRTQDISLVYVSFLLYILYLMLCALYLKFHLFLFPLFFFFCFFFIFNKQYEKGVSGIVGRAEILACTFFSLSFLSYHKYVK